MNERIMTNYAERMERAGKAYEKARCALTDYLGALPLNHGSIGDRCFLEEQLKDAERNLLKAAMGWAV